MPVGPPGTPGPGDGSSGGSSSGGTGLIGPDGELLNVFTDGGGIVNEFTCDDPGVLSIGNNVDIEMPSAVGWYEDNRYYLSIGARTLCYDFYTKGWTDVGFGRIASVAVVKQRAVPTEVIYAPHNTTATGGPQDAVVYHSHKMLDVRAENISAQWVKEIEYAPFDGDGPDHEREKTLQSAMIWGDFTLPDDDHSPTQSIGTITFFSESGYEESYPIWPVKLYGVQGDNAPRIYKPGVLCYQEFSAACVGYLLGIRLSFTIDCVAVSEAKVYYTPVATS